MNCGMLDARCSKGHGAGIGASGINGAQTGGIYIKGGMILAVGTDGAGIGSATNGGIGSINISGGIISAYGSAFRNYSGSRF